MPANEDRNQISVVEKKNPGSEKNSATGFLYDVIKSVSFLMISGQVSSLRL